MHLKQPRKVVPMDKPMQVSRAIDQIPGIGPIEVAVTRRPKEVTLDIIVSVLAPPQPQQKPSE